MSQHVTFIAISKPLNVNLITFNKAFIFLSYLIDKNLVFIYLIKDFLSKPPCIPFISDSELELTTINMWKYLITENRFDKQE
ncbi:hypothetical protein LOS11_14665, partial [Proteus mirabilis]|uniref:hypothetical protein n=1 Tax=Proteus mirabilis TaxID=584 RepID=UPI001E3FC74C